MQIKRSFHHGLFLLMALLAILPVAASVIPVDLPPPDARPPAKDKPVKVYILSGQSNMVGFGAIKEGNPTYRSVILSGDPSARVTALPVGRAAMLPLPVHEASASIYAGAYDAKADYSKLKPVKQEPVALGHTEVTLPSIEGPHTVVVNASIEVPYNGNYELRPGLESSTFCVAQLDGKDVYRKGEDGRIVLVKSTLKKGQRYPVRITYLKGGSAALWMEQVDLKGIGHLGWVLDELGRFRHLRGADGAWVKLPDVMYNDAYTGKGHTAPHGVEAGGGTFGPALGFGFVMGAFHDEPVLVIKASEGNRSLGWDILPPGSERYTFEGKEYPGYGETVMKDGTIGKPGPTDWYAGKQYDDFTKSIRAVLDNFGERYPQYKDQGYEVAGFVWWQGHKDGLNAAHMARYEENMVNLIKAWRKEFNAPKAPWTIATVAFHGDKLSPNYVKIAEAQLNVANPKLHPELAGTVKTIDARPFWRDAGLSPRNQDYHYNHNAETYMLCGDALGRAMVELNGGKAIYPEPGMIKAVDAPPFMKAEEISAYQDMIPAIKPIVFEKLLPAMTAPGVVVSFFDRRGHPYETILGGFRPKKPNKSDFMIESQLDEIIKQYEVCGVDEFSWKRFGPDMQTAEWQYLSFDPAEKKTDSKGDRYRQITLPAGSENWVASDFDAAKAGWKSGKAPFGQKNGKLEPLMSNCKVSHCGCHIMPGTLWDKEVLLMRQTFDVPKLDPAHRYRIVVGGAGHAWSGEGFALYLNGKLVSESLAGYYKDGGQARGALILNDLLPEFEGGKVTIALKGFLRMNGHRNSPADPSGHLSVWMESAKLSPITLEMVARLKP